MLRSALEHVTHRIVVRRRLPPPFAAARIYVSSEDGLRYLGGMAQVDPTLLGLAAEVVGLGDTVWDIGANLGLFSFAAAVAAGPSGRVLAVEPDTLMVGLLRRSAAVNVGHASVDILSAAVSDEESIAHFHVARRNRSTNYLEGFGSSQTGGVRATNLVPALTLDWLASPLPSARCDQDRCGGSRSSRPLAVPACSGMLPLSFARSQPATPKPCGIYWTYMAISCMTVIGHPVSECQ